MNSIDSAAVILKKAGKILEILPGKDLVDSSLIESL
jgi:hypothetical protein